MEVLLDVRRLRTHFHTSAGVIRAVDGVSWDVRKGETVALVGEIGFKGRNLLALTEEEMRQVRGSEIGMVFQEPMTSLNPVLTIGRQLTETLQQHRGADRATADRRAVELLSLVGIADPQRRLGQYPHQLSGGMRQRIMIAIALTCEPRLIIADEPTTALDVTIQAQILELMQSLTKRLGVALIIITHNLSLIHI